MIKFDDEPAIRREHKYTVDVYKRTGGAGIVRINRGGPYYLEAKAPSSLKIAGACWVLPGLRPAGRRAADDL